MGEGRGGEGGLLCRFAVGDCGFVFGFVFFLSFVSVGGLVGWLVASPTITKIKQSQTCVFLCFCFFLIQILEYIPAVFSVCLKF